MASLTTGGVTLHDPVEETVGGNPGVRSLAVVSGYARSSTAVTQSPMTPDAVQIPGTRIIGSGTSFPRSATGTTFIPPSSDTDPYVGYKTTVGAPARTWSPIVSSQRTGTGVTFLHPLSINQVQPPPTTMDFGGTAARLQRGQRFGTQAVFFKDQGGTGVRIHTGRFRGSQVFDLAESASVWTRVGQAGADLADLKAAGQMAGGAQVRTGAAGADLVVVIPAGGSAARHNVGKFAPSLQQLTDVGGFAGRNGTGRGIELLSRPYQELWTEAGPYTWPGGYVDLSVLHPTSDAYEVGWYVVPTGTDLSLGTDPVDEFWAYVGWWDEDFKETSTDGYSFGGAIGTGPYYYGIAGGPSGTFRQPASTVQYLDPGDLYCYVYGNHFDSTDPTEIKPDSISLPDPPFPLSPIAHIPAGPRPSVTFGAETRNPPSNDKLRSFVDMPGESGSLTFSDLAATMQVSEPDLTFAANTQGSVWFRWRPNFVGDGVVTSSPDVALEAYVGPLPVEPTIGVNGYRGEWDSATTYNPGDVVFFQDKYYTTSVSTTHAPDYVGVADTPIFGSISVASGEPGMVTLTLPHRVTLPPGDYFYVAKNFLNTDYRFGSPDLVGPTLSSVIRSYANSSTSSWSGSGASYSYTFVLSDSTTATEVAGLKADRSSPFGSLFTYEKFTTTAAVTFDQISVYSNGGYGSETPTIGLTSEVGTTPSGTNAWLSLVSDPNPWVEAPDGNPLSFDNLLPVGGGVGTVTYDMRANEIYYIRAYSLGEESGSLPLSWTTQEHHLDLSLVDDTLATTPSYLGVAIVGADPSETINFTVDSDTTVLATVDVDESGYSEREQIPIPSLDDGVHLLVGVGVTSGRTGSVAFTVSPVEVLPEDPTEPPAPPVIVPDPVPVARWRFQNPTDLTYWDMPINPTEHESVLLPRTLNTHSTTSFFGQPLVFEGGRRARTWSMKGHLFTLQDVETLRSWLLPYQIYLRDDFGRTFIVKITGVQTIPIRDLTHPEHHTYVVSALLYGKVPT